MTNKKNLKQWFFLVWIQGSNPQSINLPKKNLTGKYSSFTIAGGAIGVTHNKFKKWHQTFIDNLLASIKLHKISKLIVINHEDCGAIKIAEGKKDLDEDESHKTSYQKLKQLLNKKFPKLRLEFHIMKLNQTIIKLQQLLILK